MYRRLFWPVLAPSMLLGVASGATVPVSVLAAMELGASAALASLIVAMVGATALATTVFAGMLIDRIGDRRAMLLSTGAGAVVTALTVIALVWAGPGALWLFTAASMLRAPVMNVWGLARQALVADQVAPLERGRAMTALGGTMRAGSLVGPLASALLLLWLPLWSVFVFSICCALLALAILMSRRGSTLDDQAAAARAGGDRQPDAADLVVRWRAVALAGVSVATLAIARVAQPVVVQLWGVHLSQSASTISLLIAMGAAVELVMMWPGGYFKDRIGRSPVLVACLVVYGLGFVLMPTLPTLFGMVSAVFVMALGNGLGAGINMTIGADLSPPVGRAKFLGIWALFSGTGVLIGPATVSALVAASGVGAAIFGIAGLALGGAAWMAGWARTVDLPRGIGVEPSAK
ncbi:MFS transporter [Aestuariimicrobium ganziense]|uniref:MFS transporter n=1 Tax=Aestuariimicrobium ganziense TaxID=2773677 RepID=UPI0019408FB4|nr:MFS transporter [Aestuariimicrobium ganziense]